MITDHTAQQTDKNPDHSVKRIFRQKDGVQLNKISETVNSFNLGWYDNKSDETVEYYAHPTTNKKKGGGD